MKRNDAVLDGMGRDIPNQPCVVSVDVKQHEEKGCCSDLQGPYPG